jgi:uncharacterized protein (TIGR00251 family)
VSPAPPAGETSFEGLETKPDPGGAVTIRLRVSAGASRSRVLGVHGGALKLSVSAAPEKGKANREVLRLVAERFSVPVSSVAIVSGETAPDKVLKIAISEAELRRRLRL